MRLTDAMPDSIATTRALRSVGFRDAEIRTAIRHGTVIRVREGVVATPDCHPSVVEAALIGGRVAGASAARVLGLWAPPHRRLVVEVPRGAHVPATDATIIRGPAGPNRFGVSTATELVTQILRCEPPHFAIAVLDSMLRRSRMTRIDIEVAAAGLPRRLRRRLALIDARAESGTESIVRVLLALEGIVATPQVRVPFTDLERLDLVIGDRLVIECDSRAHHSTPAELDRDNARDLMLTALGYYVIRIRYRAAVSDPAGVVSAIRAVMDAGLHLDHTAPSRRATP
jgi:very-short-patch-repair endonuclease